MFFRAYIPRPPLSEFVELLWYSESLDPSHEKERRLPDGSTAVIFNLREDRLRVYDRHAHDRCESFGGCLVSGAHSRFAVIDTANQASVMGVHFKPGGATPFVGVPADELRDAHAPLEALWGAKAAELRNRLLEAGTAEARFHILETALLERMAQPPGRHPAVAFALEEFRRFPPTRTVSEVSSLASLSSKRFIQLFNQEVGLTPKLFCRGRRFQGALRLIERGPRVEWAELALECGYYDQAHLIRDFRTFSGITPAAYLKRRGEQRNHVPLLG